MTHSQNDKTENRLEKAIKKARKLGPEEAAELVDILVPGYSDSLVEALVQAAHAEARATAKRSVVDYANNETWTNTKKVTSILDDLESEHLENIYKMLKKRATNTDSRAEYVGYAVARLIRAGFSPIEIFDITRGIIEIDSEEKLNETPLAKALLNLI